jgi:Tol biopolymer transport system component
MMTAGMHRRPRVFAAMLVAAASMYAATAEAQGRDPVTHEALWLMPRVGAPAPSPGGKWVVFSLTEPAYDESTQVSDLWIVPADGSAEPRRLTSTRAGESNVVWSPDSRRIAFVTKREGDAQSQVYVLDLSGGEAARVTSVSTGASSPQWRPDGKAILFTSRVYHGAPDEEANVRMAEEQKKQQYTVRAYDSFPVRRWDRWLDDRQVHVLVQTLEPGAKARDLLAGTRLVQSPGFGGRATDSIEELDAIWAPDGRSILFVATTTRHMSAYSDVHTQLYQVPAGGGEPRQLTSGNVTYERPQFRPDGRAL